MQTAELLRRQIQTTQDLQSVVKTMKALAAVNIRQYERATESLDSYNETVEMGFQIVLRNRPLITRGFRPPPLTQAGAIVFGSDQGMCGQLNDQVVAHAVDSLNELSLSSDKKYVAAVGVRAATRMEDADYPTEQTFSVPGSVSGISLHVQELVFLVEEWRFQRKIDYVFLFFSEHLSGASYRPQTVRLLPLDIEWLRRIEQRKWEGRTLPMFTMEGEALFSALVRQFIFSSLFRAFAESLASENASRLAAMQGAEKNIEERLADLKTQYNQQRQMTITEELLDIISGFEALKEEKEKG
jgi:F-type H+-transporting ATPase subunit gamma